MIVRHFLRWIQTAAPGERADASSALARAYLYSDLSCDDRLAAEAAMTVLLDDPSPLVRAALAEALATADTAPHGIILALANDQPDVAEIVIARSPLIFEAELVELAARGGERIQCAVASRVPLPQAVAAAIAEIGRGAACLTLVENRNAVLGSEELARIAERHGHLAALREALLVHPELALETRQLLVAKLSDTLARFVAHRAWLPQERALDVTREACDRATVEIASASRQGEVAPLVHHLVRSGQLTGGLILRALLAGNLRFFVDAFAELSGMMPERVAALVADRTGHGLRALYDQSGLPPAAFRAFRAALEVIYEAECAEDLLAHSVLRRHMVEQVLARYEEGCDSEMDHLLALLRKLAGEAAREEARLYTADLLAAA